MRSRRLTILAYLMRAHANINKVNLSTIIKVSGGLYCEAN